MTVATDTRSWQRYPVGSPAPPNGPPAAPALFPLLDWLEQTHRFKSLSVESLWHDRPVRGGSAPSSHRGAAFDARYENPGPGRQYMLDNVLPTLINYSFELDIQQIHDYVGARVWKASRSSDSNGGWARQTDGSHSGMMGASWAQWLHVEAGEWAWNDNRPVPDKIGTALEADMANMTVASWGPGRLDLFVTGEDKRLYHRAYWQEWHGWEDLGGQLVGAPAAVSWGPDRIDIFGTGLDGQVWQIGWQGADGWSAWHAHGDQP